MRYISSDFFICFVWRTVERANNHAEYLPQRTDMMQWWAEYLDGLKKIV
jgi:hypothetical protein